MSKTPKQRKNDEQIPQDNDLQQLLKTLDPASCHTTEPILKAPHLPKAKKPARVAPVAQPVIENDEEDLDQYPELRADNAEQFWNIVAILDWHDNKVIAPSEALQEYEFHILSNFKPLVDDLDDRLTQSGFWNAYPTPAGTKRVYLLTLISHGKNVYLDVMDTPDIMADYLEDNGFLAFIESGWC